MYVMQISTHCPHDCPMINADRRKEMAAIIQQMDQTLLPKYGIKMAGSWTDVGAHTMYAVYDTPTLDALWACISEPALAGWLGWNTNEVKVVLGDEEAKAMLIHA